MTNIGQPDGPRVLRGLGNSLLPPNLDHTVFDSVHWCTAAEAFHATRQPHREHALFMGPTSGAAYLVARWYAREHPDALTAVLRLDKGFRYLDTVYDDAWPAGEGLAAQTVPDAPVPVDGATVPGTRWSAFAWGRRTRAEVLADAAEVLAGAR